MMWSTPSDDNNFNITAKCRVGHKDDILCLDASSQFIISGGTDGLVSIWNLFAGTLKYSIELPRPSSKGVLIQSILNPAVENDFESESVSASDNDEVRDSAEEELEVSTFNLLFRR